VTSNENNDERRIDAGAKIHDNRLQSKTAKKSAAAKAGAQVTQMQCWVMPMFAWLLLPYLTSL